MEEMANAEIRLVLKFEPNNVPANEIVAICDYIEADIENEIQMNHEEWRGRIATVRKWLLDSLQQESDRPEKFPPERAAGYQPRKKGNFALRPPSNGSNVSKPASG
jgi:hypothetical protein